MLSVFCPSRGRPQAAHELLESFSTTRSTLDARLVFLLDEDDPTIGDYPKVRKILGEPTGDPTGPLNKAVLRADVAHVGFCGDDTRFETPGWDTLVLAELANGPAIVWGNDGHDKPWPSTVFMNIEIPRALGYMVPPTLRHGFFDIAWMIFAGGIYNDWGQVVFPPQNIARQLPALMFRHNNLPAGHPDGPSAEAIAADERAYKEWQRTSMWQDRALVLGLARKVA